MTYETGNKQNGIDQDGLTTDPLVQLTRKNHELALKYRALMGSGYDSDQIERLNPKRAVDLRGTG